MFPRNLFEFMPDGAEGADLGDTSGGGQPAGDIASAVVPAPEPAAASAAAPAATIDWDSLAESPEFQERQREQFTEWLNEAAAQYEDPNTHVQQDPFADVLEGFDALGLPPDRIDAWLQSKFQPFTQVAQQYQTDKQLGQINEQLDTLSAQHPDMFGEPAGELAGDNRYMTLGLSFVLQEQAKQNGQTLDSGRALQQTTEWLANRDQKVSQAAVARYKAELEGLASAPHDPAGSGHQGAEAGAPAASEQEVVSRWLERQRAA